MMFVKMKRSTKLIPVSMIVVAIQGKTKKKI